MARSCERCGAEFSDDHAGGLCPNCLGGMVVSPTGEPVEELPLKVGDTFRGMEVVELLGRGGMGVVYKARQPGLERFVALKILPRKFLTDDEFRIRFQREAKAMAGLSHPNIVGVYDFGVEGNLTFLAMEYVDGVDLRRVLRERRLTPQEALKIVPQLCDALEYAHSQGVVHRDIKPENILLDLQGRLKIADFGLAKILGSEAGRATLTRTDVAMGTPHYMAPEQFESPKDVDHRADIYSLGVVFYEMLTGELPIGKFAPPSKRVEIDVRLDEVVLKALEKSPAMRYQHASEVKDDVTRLGSIEKTPALIVRAHFPLGAQTAVLFALAFYALAHVALLARRSPLLPLRTADILWLGGACLASLAAARSYIGLRRKWRKEEASPPQTWHAASMALAVLYGLCFFWTKGREAPGIVSSMVPFLEFGAILMTAYSVVKTSRSGVSMVRRLPAWAALLIVIVPTAYSISCAQPPTRQANAGVTIELRNATVQEGIEQFRKQMTKEELILDATNIPQDYRIDQFVVRDRPWREALEAFLKKGGLVIDEEQNGIIKISRVVHVTFSLKDADIRSVIELIARISHANIAMAPDVQGTVTLSIKDVPWPDALEAAVKTAGHYEVVREPSGIVRIVRSGHATPK